MSRREQTKEHNDAILSKLDLEDTLAQYQAGERSTGRGNHFINLICLLLYLKKNGQKWSRSWVLREIGKPDRIEEAETETRLHYRLRFPDCVCQGEHWAEVVIKDDELAGFGAY